MASALVRGWNQPVVVYDIDGERAIALAEAVGGSVAGSNAEVAQQVDVVVLCHKPAQLDEVASEIRDHAPAVVSILGGVPVANVEAAYPDKPVYRLMPNQAAEVRRGVSCYVAGSRASEVARTSWRSWGSNTNREPAPALSVSPASTSTSPSTMVR